MTSFCVKYMKTLIVYYSRTKTTKKVVLRLAKLLEARAVELIDQQDRRGVMGYLSGGRDAFRKTLAKIDTVKANVEDYDLVIIATPVWVGTMAPAIRTFVTDNRDKFKKIAILTTQGGKKRQRVFADLKALTGLAAQAEVMFVTRDVSQDLYEDDLNKFIAKLAL